MIDSDRIFNLLRKVKKLAQQYRQLTGKPLGVTGEIAEYEAARLLGVTLTPARQGGYDATERKNHRVRKLQIKGRCVLAKGKKDQTIGSIKIEKEFDAVLMVLVDENFNAIAIYEADREQVIRALTAPGSVARNRRGALRVSKFKSIGHLRWPKPAP